MLIELEDNTVNSVERTNITSVKIEYFSIFDFEIEARANTFFLTLMDIS